jgi:hypothetical protein
MSKKDKEIPAGTDVAILENLDALSKEQLLEFAEKQGIEIAAEAEKETIIKAINDFFVPQKSDAPAQGKNGQNEKPDGSGGVEIVSTIRAGKTITAVTGKPITFDKDGKANVHPRDAEYLNTCPGFGN